MSLQTDKAANVTSVLFQYTDPDANVFHHEFTVPDNARIPVVAVQADLVGVDNGAYCTFTTGLTQSRGIMYYAVGSGALSVQPGGPGSACGEHFFITQERSNATYSDPSSTPAAAVSQAIGTAVPCTIASLLDDEPAAVEQMRRIRDEQMKAPAGEFLTEVLARHPADLAALLASHPALREECREMLLEAARIATDGTRFDAELIERAEQLVGHAGPLAPYSMAGIPGALQTILTSLSGRTLREGLVRASETIIPRFASSPPI